MTTETTHATEKPQNKKSRLDNVIYEITFAGTYIATGYGGNAGTSEKGYRITVKIPHTSIDKKSNASAKSVFKNDLAPSLMKRKYPDFQRLSTYHIVNVTSNDPQALARNVDLLTYEGLVSYIEYEEFDVNPLLYADADALRTAIKKYQEDPDGYEKLEEHLNQVNGGKLQRQQDALRANQDFNPREDDDEPIDTAEALKLGSGATDTTPPEKKSAHAPDKKDDDEPIDTAEALKLGSGATDTTPPEKKSAHAPDKKDDKASKL